MPGRNKVNSSRSAPYTVPQPRQSAASTISKRTVAKTEFAVNDRFQCLWNDYVYYEVKIVKVEKKDDQEPLYTVHYKGWNKNRDEKMSHSDAVERFIDLDSTPENLASKLKSIEAPKPSRRRTRIPTQKKELLNENVHGFDADEPTASHVTQQEPSIADLSATSAPIFAVNDRFQCLWKDFVYYEVKIKKVEKKEDGEPLYTIHYQGWNKRSDEKISHSDALERFIGSDSAPAKLEGDNATQSSNRNATQKDELLNEDAHGFEADEPIDTPERHQAEEAFPANLFKILEKDHELVTGRTSLPKVPGKFTVDHVLTDYHNSLLARMSEAEAYPTGLHLDKLVGLFNKTINKGILYKFECLQFRKWLDLKRQQFNLSEPSLKDILAEHKSFIGPQNAVPEEGNANSVNFHTLNDFIDTYGPIHLIRFLWAALKQKDHPDYAIHVEVINEILHFVSLRVGKYFNAGKDYEPASSAYKRTMSSI